MTLREALQSAYDNPGQLVIVDGNKFGIERTFNHNITLWRLTPELRRGNYLRSFAIAYNRDYKMVLDEIEPHFKTEMEA